MIREKHEYRINKKGAECFRTFDREQAEARLAELSAKRPGVYTLQVRHCLIDRYGTLECSGNKPSWSCWY